MVFPPLPGGLKGALVGVVFRYYAELDLERPLQVVVLLLSLGVPLVLLRPLPLRVLCRLLYLRRDRRGLLQLLLVGLHHLPLLRVVAPLHLAVKELGHGFLLVGHGAAQVSGHLHDVHHPLPVAHRQQLLVLIGRPELQRPDRAGCDGGHHTRLVRAVQKVPPFQAAVDQGNVDQAGPGWTPATGGHGVVRARRVEDGHAVALLPDVERPVAHREEDVFEERGPLDGGGVAKVGVVNCLGELRVVHVGRLDEVCVDYFPVHGGGPKHVAEPVLEAKGKLDSAEIPRHLHAIQGDAIRRHPDDLPLLGVLLDADVPEHQLPIPRHRHKHVAVLRARLVDIPGELGHLYALRQPHEVGDGPRVRVLHRTQQRVLHLRHR
mmetsp:Transcript_38086/g.64024  ORF Transcript_38086/g.64024 Transcript_38086/m.64024 type:complete len:377 (+) Transcript_38086:314-1444(+)